MQDSLNQGRGGLSSGRRMGSGRSTQAGVGNRARILRAAVEPLEQRRLLTTYYVSPAGSDAAAGTSAASPWASVTKVDATVFQPGDSILFQRGGEWHGQLEGSADGTAAAPIIYGDYGDTNLSKPIFEGSDYVPSNAFSSQGNSVYTFSTSTTGGKAYWVYLNHVALLAATSGSAAMPAGSFFVSGTTVWMNTGGVNPATAAVSVGVRATGQNADQGVIASNGHSYLTFNNLIGRETAQISGDGSLGGGIIDAYVIRVQGGTNVTLNNCEAYYGGKHHVGAIDTTKFLANGLTVSGGVNGVSGNTLPYGNSTALVAYADQNVHHTTQQWIDCTVSNYFGDQPAFLTHNDGADSIDSLLIQNLKSYGSPVALQPGNNIAITYRGGLISNNTLTAYGSTGTTELIDGVHVYSDNGSTGQKIEMYADNSTIQNCLVTGSGQVGGIQSYGSNATIRFNTVSMQGYASAAIQLGSASNATKLYGNITTGTGNALLINGSPTYTADYDLFDSTAGGPFIKVGSTTYSGIAAYRSATGQEAHGVVADPKFVSVGGGDYSLQSTSPAINLIPIGNISGVSTDIRGFARPSANVYDAGAFEYPSVLHQPTVATAASASANPVAGVTTNLSVLGASQDGESTLIYTWSLTGAPPATVTFNASATNAAKATTATFSKAGTYNFLVTISNGQFSATSAVSVVVNATPTAVVVTPASGFIPVNTTQQFTAALNDQFGKAITGQTIAYAVTNGGGTISPTGLYTAPATTGPATISAIIGGKTGTASITVTPPNQAPTIAIAASASPNPVTGVSTALSVLGADDNGESNLIYTWSLVGTPPAAVSYSVNGTNAAKSTLVTFTANGQYNFLVTVRDSGNLAATSTVSVTVNAIVPIVVDGSLDGRYGSPIVIQSQATNYGNGNLGSPTAPYSQLVAGYVVIDAANDKLNLFLAGSLNLNNAHLDLLIDSVASGGVANLASLANISPYSQSFSTIKFDAGFRPDHIFTFTFGGGYSLDYVNLNTSAHTAATITDPANGLATSGSGMPFFQERINNALTATRVAGGAGASATTGAEFAFSLSGLGYTAANFASGVPINISAMISYGSHTQGTNQILAPYALNAAEIAKDGGIYSYYGNGNFDFSNETRFAGNQFFQAAPPPTPNAAPTIASAPAATPNPVTGTTAALSVLGADDGGEAGLTYTWSLAGTPPAPVSFSANGTNAAKQTTATFTQTGTYNFLVTISDGSLSTVGSVTVTVNAAAVTPDVSSFTINGGAIQRSRVQQLTVTFNTPVTLDSNAISLTRTSNGVTTPVTFTAASSDGGKTYALTPTSDFVDGSLTDGGYAVVVKPSFVHSQADLSKTISGANRVYSFYRLFGDIDGNATVDFNDFLTLQNAFNSTTASPNFASGLDYENNGVIDFNDFLALQNRFGQHAETAIVPAAQVAAIKVTEPAYDSVWKRSFTVKKAGLFTFYTASDHASALFIDGKRVVNNAAAHGYSEMSGTVKLTAGIHAIEVRSIQKMAVRRLSVSYAGLGLKKQSISDEVLKASRPLN